MFVVTQMEYTAQNLEYAVSVFYNGEQEDRAKAHAWLTVAQRVPEAWNFVWELLQPTKVIFAHGTSRYLFNLNVLGKYNSIRNIRKYQTGNIHFIMARPLRTLISCKILHTYVISMFELIL